jgi:hypothetical protein
LPWADRYPAARVSQEASMPAQFAATLKAIAAGAKSMTPAAAVKNIEGWQAHLETVDVPGAKGLSADLGRLKKLLQADSLDGAAIGQLMAKIAGGTARIAGRAEGKRGAQVKELADALEKATADQG